MPFRERSVFRHLTIRSRGASFTQAQEPLRRMVPRPVPEDRSRRILAVPIRSVEREFRARGTLVRIANVGPRDNRTAKRKSVHTVSKDASNLVLRCNCNTYATGSQLAPKHVLDFRPAVGRLCSLQSSACLSQAISLDRTADLYMIRRCTSRTPALYMARAGNLGRIS